MDIVWSKRSKGHLRSLFEHIAHEDEKTAQAIVARIIDVAEIVLADHPETGRAGRVQSTRELIISKTPYVLAYNIKNDTISIIAVWHTSRQWPKVWL